MKEKIFFIIVLRFIMNGDIIFHSKRGEKIVANELEISEAKEVLLSS